MNARLPAVTGDREWMVDALCAQTDPEVFFPEQGGSTRAAKAVCAACPVRDECLAYALERREQHGVWGGTTELERRRLRRELRTASEVAA